MNVIKAETAYPATNIMEHESQNSSTKIISFKTVSLETVPVLLDFFKGHTSVSTDYTVGGIVMWTKYFNYSFDIIEDTLFLKANYPGKDTTIYYMPFGSIDNETAIGLLKKYCCANGCHGLLIISEERDTPEIYMEDANSIYESGWMEYLYPIDKMCGFPGKKMEKKRNHLHSFLKRYPDYSVEAINDTNIPELIEFTQSLANQHDDYQFLYENHAVVEILQNYSICHFLGITLRVEGKIVGFTFGEVSGDTLHVHAEKGDVNIHGVYQMLITTFCEQIKTAYPEVIIVNRQDDMGNDDLRQSKMSYHPNRFIHKLLQKI
jgi:hypothetical protein